MMIYLAAVLGIAKEDVRGRHPVSTSYVRGDKD